MIAIEQMKKKSVLLGNGINIQFGGKAYSNRFILSRIVFNALCDKYDSLFEGTLSGKEIENIFRGLLPTANSVLDGKYDEISMDEKEVKEAISEFKEQNSNRSKFEHYYDIPLEDWFLLLRLAFLDNPDLADMWISSKQSYLINNRVSGVLLVNKADKKLLRLKNTNEKKYVTASGNVYSNMISKLPCVLDELSNGCVFRRIRKIFSYVFVDEIQDFVGYDLEVIKKLHEVGCNMTLVGDPRQTTYRTHYEAKYKKYAGGKIVIFVQDNIAGMNIDTTTLSTSYRNNQIICDLANQMYPDMKPCDSAMNEKTGHDGIFWVHENDIDKYVDIYNPVQLRYDKRTKVNPIPKTMNFGLSKGLTFNRVLIYPTKPMLDWLSGKSKDMKDESLSKFYVAVTRARYSVAFVYKTKRLPTNDIGTKWTPDVL